MSWCAGVGVGQVMVVSVSVSCKLVMGWPVGLSLKYRHKQLAKGENNT